MSIYKLIITHLFIQLAHTVIPMELNKSSPPNKITIVAEISREIYIQPRLKTLWQRCNLSNFQIPLQPPAQFGAEDQIVLDKSLSLYLQI